MRPLRIGGGPGAGLRREDHGPVTVLTLDRPAARNALSGALAERLAATLAELDDDPDTRVVVLTGSAPGFCAGSDLKELAPLAPVQVARHEARVGAAVRTIPLLGIPVVAAVEGFALGGGFLLALACDVVVTAEDARWRLPEVPLGWVPPWGLQALVARAGPATARRLCWGDRPVDAAELHRLGVVDDLVRPGEALAAAVSVAARLAALPPHAVASTKRAFADAVAGPAEALDARTTWMFGADSATGTARATLAGSLDGPVRKVV